MTECPYNSSINVDKCKTCDPHCGFAFKERARRKALVNGGKGLTLDAKGRAHLVIKRRK